MENSFQQRRIKTSVGLRLRLKNDAELWGCGMPPLGWSLPQNYIYFWGSRNAYFGAVSDVFLMNEQ